MELNAEQIIKALECCGSNNPCGEECFGHDIKGLSECTKILAQNALALINSQEQRIKELTQANEQLSESYDHLEKTKDELLLERSRLTEENERLKVPMYLLRADGGVELMPTIESIKADTVRKMQERLKAKMRNTAKYSFGRREYSVIGEEFIDQIAKEMLDDNT